MGQNTGNQEYSARTLGATWGIISAVMVPIVIVLICIGWRILKRRKQEEHDENDFMPIKTRAIDPDESMKINSDDDSIPYKKDMIEDSPEPSEPLKVVDIENENTYPYEPQYQGGQPQYQYQPAQPFQQFEQPKPQAQPFQQFEQPKQQAQPFQQFEQPKQQPQTSRAWSGETEIN